MFASLVFNLAWFWVRELALKFGPGLPVEPPLTPATRLCLFNSPPVGLWAVVARDPYYHFSKRLHGFDRGYAVCIHAYLVLDFA